MAKTSSVPGPGGRKQLGYVRVQDHHTFLFIYFWPGLTM